MNIHELQYIIEDTNPDIRLKGIDFGLFQIKLSKHYDSKNFEKDDLISYNPTAKLEGEVLVIKEDPIDLEDSLLYSVQIMKNDPDWYWHNKFLAPGTIYFKI